MTKNEIEIIRCALVQLMINYKNYIKEIEIIISKLDKGEEKKEIEIIE